MRQATHWATEQEPLAISGIQEPHEAKTIATGKG